MNPWLVGIITTVHIVVCLFLIGVVLLQSGKSADIAAAFGGMGSQTAFGPRSAANALTNATTWAAIIFMLTSFTLAIAASRSGGSSGGGSVLDNAPTKQAPAKSK
jgi:preprotein translocase subunit SecG